jgi:alanine or glycine:cation symporter, AGCS family
MTGTFWDTVVVCAMTGLVIVVTGAHQTGGDGPAMTHAAFGSIPTIGQPVLLAGLATFVFSTLIGWSYYGEKAIEYLGGVRLIPLYRWLWVVAIVFGATIPSAIVINFADAANGLMAAPNLISLLLLGSVVASETRRYIDSRSRKENAPSFTRP